MIHNHDKSLCRWSFQINGYCPYKEMLNMLVNTHCAEKIKCKDKQCLYIMLKKTGHKTEKELIKSKFPEMLKPNGPIEAEDMLSNVNIDEVLHDFSIASIPKIKTNSIFINGPFYHIDFDMRDFEKTHNSVLKNLNLNKLYSEKFKSFGCVLNTDTWNSSNENGHWVAIYGIFLEPKNTENKPICQLEYFNSSGNDLSDFVEIKHWIAKKKSEYPSFDIKEIEVVDEPLQGDTVNCGVWTLIYIKSRLEGKPINYFYKFNVNDSFIDKSRKYLFTN